MARTLERHAPPSGVNAMRRPVGRRMSLQLAVVLGILVQVVLDVTIFCLRRASHFVGRALDLLRGTANGFARDFLNLSSRLFDSSFHLIFVNAHKLKSPADIAGERPTRMT